MTLSLNEIEGTVTKACAGSGIDYGVAAEIGTAVAHLVNLGLDGIGTVADALRSDLPALSRGPAQVDMAIASGSHEVATEDPLLLFGLAGVARDSGDNRFEGETFELRGPGWQVVLADGVVSLESAVAPHFTPTANAPTDDWRYVEMRAAATYVPSSEQSRIAGAGAGLTDND